MIRASCGLICLAFATAGWSQPPFPGGSPASSLVSLAGDSAVQKDLGVSGRLASKLKALSREEASDLQKLQPGMNEVRRMMSASAEDRAKLAADLQARMTSAAKNLRAKYEPRLKSLISMEQFGRLKEISLQAAGPSALLEDDVAEALGLSSEQKTKLQEAAKAGNREVQSVMRSAGGPAAFPRIEKKLMEAKKSSDQRLLQVITAEQQTKFETLKGRRFDLARLRSGQSFPRPF